MTDKNYTDITLVLDESGSMLKVKNDTEQGVRKFVEAQQRLDLENGFKTRISLVKFNSIVTCNVTAVDIKNFELPRFNPEGWTALYDAVGTTINRVGMRLADMQEEHRPGKVIFVIITDGEENSSKEFRYAWQIANMIQHQRNKFNWQFMYIGANVDAFKNAEYLHIPVASTINWAPNIGGTASLYGSLSDSIASFKIGARGQSIFASSDYEAQNLASGTQINDLSKIKIGGTD